MEDPLDKVRAFYDGDPEREWKRLESGAQNRLEYLVTVHALEQHLPRLDRPRRVLDAGGGPGRYTVLLAGRGYQVTLLDLSPGLLSLARKRIDAAGLAIAANVEAVVEGSFVDLSAFPDESFDVVLCLGGAFSHLVDPEERRRALAEFRRVVRTDGVVLLSAMNHLGAFRAVVQWWRDEQTIELFYRLRQGQALDIGNASPAYLYRPEELMTLLGEAGFTVERLYGAEGIGAHLQEERLLGIMGDPVVWPAWREVLLATADHPNVVGVARSLLVVARAPYVQAAVIAPGVE